MLGSSCRQHLPHNNDGDSVNIYIYREQNNNSMRLSEALVLFVRLAVVVTESNHDVIEDDTRSGDIWEAINYNNNNVNNTEEDHDINEHINHQDHEVINQSSLSPNATISSFIISLVTSSTTSITSSSNNNKQL